MENYVVVTCCHKYAYCTWDTPNQRVYLPSVHGVSVISFPMTENALDWCWLLRSLGHRNLLKHRHQSLICQVIHNQWPQIHSCRLRLQLNKVEVSSKWCSGTCTMMLLWWGETLARNFSEMVVVIELVLSSYADNVQELTRGQGRGLDLRGQGQGHAIPSSRHRNIKDMAARLQHSDFVYTKYFNVHKWKAPEHKLTGHQIKWSK